VSACSFPLAPFDEITFDEYHAEAALYEGIILAMDAKYTPSSSPLLTIDYGPRWKVCLTDPTRRQFPLQIKTEFTQKLRQIDEHGAEVTIFRQFQERTAVFTYLSSPPTFTVI
jgi:hypothetical protein